MSYQKCCVPSCNGTEKLHRFPPVKNRNRQLQWLSAVGNPDLMHCLPEKLNSYRVCHRHFEAKFIVGKKISTSGIPTLFLPGK